MISEICPSQFLFNLMLGPDIMLFTLQLAGERGDVNSSTAFVGWVIGLLCFEQFLPHELAFGAELGPRFILNKFFK